MKKIAIIGAGIAGITTAYSLAKRGHQVTVIDQRRYPAMATSYANGGQLSASNGETWNTSKNIVSGIKWIIYFLFKWVLNIFYILKFKNVLIFFRFLKIFLFKKTSFSDHISLFYFSNNRIKK